MKIVALTAPKGAGKDTAGAALVELGYRPIAFAEPIKRAIEAMFDLPAEIWDRRDWKEATLDDSGFMPGLAVSPRFLAQTIGTEWGRESIDPNVWVKAVERKIENEARQYGTDKFVVTDVRFANEAVWTRSMGGYVVEIVRPGHEWNADHTSEAGPADELIDARVHNDGTISELHDMMYEVEGDLWSG